MPKLRKIEADSISQQSQTFEKYSNLQEKQTQVPSLIDNLSNNYDYQKIQANKRKVSAKKINRSFKKNNRNDQQNILHTQKVNNKKSKSKKSEKLLEPQEGLNQKQNQDHQNSQNNKVQKRQKSPRKNKKSANKIKLSEEKEGLKDNELFFKDNQLRQKTQQYQLVESKKLVSEPDEKSNDSMKSTSVIDFNKRLKKKQKTQKQDFNNLLSRYTEDESLNSGNKIKQADDSNGQIGTKYQSDLRDLQLLVKKKQKKPKKQKQVKIKNKYFSNLSFDPEQNSNDHNDGEQPPQNSQELIIEKKEPRKTLQNLNQIIQKRVNHIKDRRQFKSSEGDMKFKNHLKMKFQEVKNFEQVQVDIEVPNFFTKKTASAALYMKNTMESEQKNAKYSQFNSENHGNPLHKTASTSNLNKSEQILTNQQRKNQQYQLQYKKKGVKRQDFFHHLNKEIKTKKRTSFCSQEIKDCFKTSTLDQQNFDEDLADDVLSNCSSRDNNGQSRDLRHRRTSVDSEQSRKSQASIKSIHSRIESNPNSGAIGKSSSKWNIEINENIKENSNSKLLNTNKSVRRISVLDNPSISEVKQSDASSSIRRLNESSLFASHNIHQPKSNNQIKFDDKSIKQEVERSFNKSFKIFQSQNQQDKDRLLNKSNPTPWNKTPHQIVEEQKESDKKLAQKLKKMIKIRNEKKIKSKHVQDQKFDEIDDMLGDNLNEKDESDEKKKKKKRKSKRSKKTKNKSKSKNVDSYFEEQADYSSGEQGHTESENSQIQSDIDEEGNIIGFVDKDAGELSINERLVRRKYLDDQQKKDEQMIERLMKGIYGRKKLEETDSQRKLRKRMDEAAKRNLLEDLQEIIPSVNQLPGYTENVVVQSKLQSLHQIDENQVQRRKLKQFEEQMVFGGLRDTYFEEKSTNFFKQNQKFQLMATALPVQKNRVSIIGPSGVKGSVIPRGKTNQNRKSLFDTKKSSVHQQIYHKRISIDRQRGDSTGNRNKLQKTVQIQLDIRNINVKEDQDIEI